MFEPSLPIFAAKVAVGVIFVWATNKLEFKEFFVAWACLIALDLL